MNPNVTAGLGPAETRSFRNARTINRVGELMSTEQSPPASARERRTVS